MATDTDMGPRAPSAGRGFRHWFLQSLTASIGIGAILWAISASPVFRVQAAFEGLAHDILAGKSFDRVRLQGLKAKLDSMPADQIRSVAVDAAVIRLRLLDVRLAEGALPVDSPYVTDVSSGLAAALSQDPSNSFLWFAEYWLNRLRGDAVDHGSGLLRMSYELGPNEVWIVEKRNPVALSNWISLPGDLLEQALSEFVRLVQSGFYAEAANIVAGPGWPIHQQMLSRLAPLSEASRHAMARELARKDLDGVSVPGIPDKRPSRPF